MKEVSTVGLWADCSQTNECTPQGGRAAAGEVIMSHQALDWGARGGVGGVASMTKHTPPEAREPSQG